MDSEWRALLICVAALVGIIVSVVGVHNYEAVIGLFY